MYECVISVSYLGAWSALCLDNALCDQQFTSMSCPRQSEPTARRVLWDTFTAIYLQIKTQL